MQVRPPPQATPFKPPLGPKIPQREVQALIPRLKSAINDIDQLQGLIAAGGVDGSLPNWDTLLQRYSLLLGRINTLSQQLAVPSPTPITANQPFGQASSESDPRAPPALSRYIVHPLNPLPPTAETSGIAQATFFEALNTVSIPHLATNTSGLLTNEVWDRSDQSALKAMDEEEVIRLRDRLRVRLEAGSSKSGKIKDMIDQVEEEYEWDTRIGGDEEGEEDAVGEEVEQGAKGDKIEEDDDDLFGDDGDDADDPIIVESQSQSKAQTKEAKEPKAPSNPRPGWNLVDYVRYMDTGVEPQRPTSS